MMPLLCLLVYQLNVGKKTVVPGKHKTLLHFDKQEEMPSKILHACEISCLDIEVLASNILKFLPVNFDNFCVTEYDTYIKIYKITFAEFTDGDLSPYCLV